jgi:hypothetical protein
MTTHHRKDDRGPNLDLALLALLGFAFLGGSPARLGFNRPGERPLNVDLRPLVPLAFLALQSFRSTDDHTESSEPERKDDHPRKSE